MQKDSLNVMTQFGYDGEDYAMLEDGSAYWVRNGFVTPITRSYFGHILKMARKQVLQNNAELYRKRSLAKKSRQLLTVYDYDIYIKDYQVVVDDFNAMWGQFRNYMNTQKAIRKLDKFEKFPEKAARYYAKQ